MRVAERRAALREELDHQSKDGATFIVMSVSRVRELLAAIEELESERRTDTDRS